MERLRSMFVLFALAMASAPAAALADLTPVATYQFQNTLTADQPGVAPLVAVDPLGQSGFLADTPYGHARQVYRFSGNANPPTSQAGLSLDTTGLITANNYSVELVFSFDSSSGWRRILDVQNRQSDNGFYVDPNSHLDVFPTGQGTTGFTANAYHDVVLTESSANQLSAYLDGTLEFSVSSALMDINNPGNLMNFFLDNVVGGGQGEYSSGKVALARLYNGVLGATQVAAQARDPFAGLGVPEPSSFTLLGIGGAGLFGAAWRRRKRSS